MSELISEENISLNAILELGNNAFIPCEQVSERFLLFRLRFKTLLSLQGDNRRILMIISARANDRVHEFDRYDYVNRVNSELALVKAYVDEDKDIIFEHTHGIEGGVTPHNLIHTLQSFQDAVLAAASLDQNNVLA